MLINTNIDWLTHDSFMIITKQCVFYRCAGKTVKGEITRLELMGNMKSCYGTWIIYYVHICLSNT